MVAQAQATRSSQSGPFSARQKSASITPGAIATLATVDGDFVFAEAAVGDTVGVSFDTKPVAGIIAGQAYIAVAGHVRIPFANITAGTLTQVAITCNVTLQKKLG